MTTDITSILCARIRMRMSIQIKDLFKDEDEENYLLKPISHINSITSTFFCTA